MIDNVYAAIDQAIFSGAQTTLIENVLAVVRFSHSYAYDAVDFFSADRFFRERPLCKIYNNEHSIA